MNPIKNNFDELKKNKKIFLLFVTFLILGQFLLQFKVATWPKLYIGLAFFSFLIVLSFSRLDDTKKISRNAFILIAVFGTLNALILPIKKNLDEQTHYFHALEVADGKLRKTVSQKNFIDVSPDFYAVADLPIKPIDDLNTNLYNKEFLKVEHKKSDYKPELLDDIGTFNNPAYIPSALGIALGQALTNRVAISYYLGRVFNVLFYALLVWLAIKISRYYKIQIFVVASLPYTLWISAGFTYDNLYYGLILLLIAQFTNFLKEKESITMKKMLWYCLTCLGLVFCKAPTILLMILPVFLSKNYYNNKKDRMKSVFLIGINFFIGALWVVQAVVLKMIRSFLYEPIIAEASSSEESSSRLFYFLSHPIDSLELLLRSLFEIPKNIIEFIQRPQIDLMSTGTLRDINLITFLFLFFLVTLILKLRMSKLLKWTTIVTFFVITVGIIYAITGDPRVFTIGDLHVSGVQGRYHFYMLAFLPLIIAPWIQGTSFPVNRLSANFDATKTQLLVMKIVFAITALNSCVALFGYL